MFGIGVIGRMGGTGPVVSAYDPAAQAYFARLTPAPDDSYKGYYNTLIIAMKAAGLWAKLDALYMLATAEAQWADQNLVQNAFNLTEINSPTFTANEGYTGNGTTSYLATGFTPSAAAGQYALNSAHISAWAIGSLNGSSVPIGARTASSAGQALLVPVASSGQYRINQDSSTGTFTSESTGFLLGTRTDASTAVGYNNTTSLGSSTAASTSVPQEPFFVGALNSAGTAANLCSVPIAMASIGAGLSADDESNFYAAVEAFLSAVGAV